MFCPFLRRYVCDTKKKGKLDVLHVELVTARCKHICAIILDAVPFILSYAFCVKGLRALTVSDAVVIICTTLCKAKKWFVFIRYCDCVLRKILRRGRN